MDILKLILIMKKQNLLHLISYISYYQIMTTSNKLVNLR